MRRDPRKIAVAAFGLAFGVAGAAFADPVERRPVDIGIDTGELTPMGAVRAGDARGVIPEWSGGLTSPIKGTKAGAPPPDPFFEDSRWFTVGPGDLEKFRVRLSEGARELLRRYDSFELPVFPTRRTAAAPRSFYEASIANLSKARLVDNGLTLEGAERGVPFPCPKTGEEAVWNHLARWRGGPTTATDGVVVPDKYGRLTIDKYRIDVLPTYNLGIAPPAIWLYRRALKTPDVVDASVLTLRDGYTPLSRPRVAWYLAPKAKKAVPAPDFAYGTPDPATNGVRTADMLDQFNGMLDRFRFKLIALKPMIVPYNAYRLSASNLEPKDFLWAEHPNPRFLRYELHRVWVVEATLKEGYKHPFPFRIYYLDEDSWQILMSDHFGPDGTIARYSEAHGQEIPEVPVFEPTLEITYDFKERRYAVSGLDNQDSAPVHGTALVPDDFEPGNAPGVPRARKR